MAANCHVLIDGKIDLRDFRSISISILDGTPKENKTPEAPKNQKTLGMLSYIRDQNYPFGWFYLENSGWFTAVYPDVMERGPIPTLGELQRPGNQCLPAGVVVLLENREREVMVLRRAILGA